jgi:glycerol-3-phosphate cytidylyltransferase
MSKKPIIGYTTGVFDLFHIGHLNILEKAKNKCDYLIVGVTDPETVFQYKGRYPIVSLEDRVSIIKAIKLVDKVVIQKSMNKIEAWNDYRFDILFHGNDWKGSSMYKEIENKLKSKGVKFEYFEYTNKTSTTIIKNKIIENSERNK